MTQLPLAVAALAAVVVLIGAGLAAVAGEMSRVHRRLDEHDGRIESLHHAVFPPPPPPKRKLPPDRMR